MRASEVNNTRKFSTFYTVGSEIGVGSFAAVHECWRKDREHAPESESSTKRQRMEDDAESSNSSAIEPSTQWSNRPLAVKAMPMDAFTLREIKILRELKSPHLICLEDAFVDSVRDQLLLVYEHAKDDLQSWIHNRGPLEEATALRVLRSLLKALNCLHSNGIMHRDVKPANILLIQKGEKHNSSNIQDFSCKLADFGLARSFRTPPVPLTEVDAEVVTLSYRAPELLLGAQHYNTAVDIWSLGCVFAELLTGKQLFRATDTSYETESQKRFYKGQLLSILSVLGDPAAEEWPLLKYYPFAYKLKRLRTGSPSQSQLETFLRRRSSAAPKQITSKTMDLLQELLRYDPAKRLTAWGALHHSAFAGLE
eukprot:gb/GECG01011880.1/.p1 GENE.gb/GECG01011880.1/~~gb/GECG01011880.1/.p1  ORF type:complete len:367 (+),score=39.66 gb/GECG01011880.1/:1-1101(+)